MQWSIQCPGKRLQDIHGEILPSILQAGQILISDARSGGQLLLRELLLFTQFPDEASDGGFRIHFAYS